MKDWKEIQRLQVQQERRQFIEETSMEQAISNAKQGLYPAGSVYKWALSAMYGPEKRGQRK